MHDCYINKFVGDTLDHAILDSGCTKSGVSWQDSGASWQDSYLESLSEDNLT